MADWKAATRDFLKQLDPLLSRLNGVDSTKLLLGGVTAVAALALLLYLVIFQDLPDLSKAKTSMDWNPAGMPPMILVGTYLRVALKSLPLIGCPPLKPNEKGTGYTLPDLEIKAPLKVDIDFLRTYLKAVDSLLEPSLRKKLEKEGKSWIADRASLPKRVPPSFLTSVTSALFPVLLSHPQCPFPGAGVVNTVNSFEWTDPSALASFDEFSKKDWLVVASLGGEMPRKKRGAEVSLAVRIEDKSSGKVIFKSTWGVLRMLPKSAKPAHDPANDKQEKRLNATDLQASSIKLFPSASSPRLWARSCGDWNPIHISTLSAKAFGLPGAIAHGNLMVAATFRAIEVQEPDHPINKTLQGNKPFKANAAFRSIMQVGKTFEVKMDQDGQFSIVKGEKLCTEGSVTTI